MKLKNIKDKFDGREIQPSPGSWEKLSQRLDSDKKSTKKPVLLWLGAVAAALLLGWILIPSLTKSDGFTPANDQIVVRDSVEDTPAASDANESILKVLTSNEQQNLVIESKPLEPEIPQLKEREVKKPGSLTNDENSAAVMDVKKEQTIETITANPAATKKDIVIAMSENPLQQKEQLSESDQLLNNALKKLSIQPANYGGSIASYSDRTINPKKLLQETEWDLEAQNRNRLENTLLDGLSRLKREAIALIDREQ